MNYNDARTACANAGGTMASQLTSDEMDVLSSLSGSKRTLGLERVNSMKVSNYFLTTKASSRFLRENR